MSQQRRASFLRRIFFGDVTPNLPAENPFAKKDSVISGRRLITREEAEQIADLEAADSGLSFGGVRLSSETHAIICGQTRSGKTTLLKQQIADALKRVKKGSDERVVIFDASGDFIPFVYAIMGDDAPVVILDPEDERCFAWDIAADITTPLQAQNLVEMLAPKEEYDHPFFLSGAQSLTKAVLEIYLIRADEAQENGKSFSWTLRDVFNALATDDATIDVLRYPTKKKLKSFETEIKLYLKRQNQDILSTIATKSSKQLLVAAMWDGRPKISVKDFVQNTDGKVIIITNSSKASAIVKELNRLFFEILAQTLQDGENLTGKRTHIFLDEFTEMGKLEALKSLLKTGLKKGVRVYLCYQNFEEVKDVYGEEQAEVILSESGTIAFLWQKSKSAAAAAEFIGKQIVIITNDNAGVNSGEQGSTIQKGTSTTQVERWTVAPEYFSKNLPLAGKKNGIAGVFFSPSVSDVWTHRFEWKEVEPFILAKSANPAHAPKMPRPGIEYQFLRAWTDEENEKFRGKPQEDPSTTAQGTQQRPPATADEKPKGFDAAKYLADLKEGKKDERPASELSVFEKIKQGRGEIDPDEMEAALKEMGFRYHD